VLYEELKLRQKYFCEKKASSKIKNSYLEKLRKLKKIGEN